MPLAREVDLVVIGGGINGTGVARDAAGRGASVLLCEQDDLAGATSSASSKLIHGGLRYLEHHEFRLVREALMEREVLLANAPHLIHPLRFILPHNHLLRPAWIIRTGLFLYDHLSRRQRLPASHGVDLRQERYGRPLTASLYKGFAYSDCWVDDSRLVVLNAVDAARRGVEIRTRTRLMEAARSDSRWQVRMKDTRRGEEITVQAKALVNAAGPWVNTVLQDALAIRPHKELRLVKGSHIVVPRLYEGQHAYILQNTDRRVVFVIPFQGDFSLIGTTDTPCTGDAGHVEIADDEIQYLVDAVNGYFSHPLKPSDVVWSYSGVRPLQDDEADNPSAVTRDYVLELDSGQGRPPVLSVIGGKITAYRKISERVVDMLCPYIGGLGPAWTHQAPLPGGDVENTDFEGFLEAFQNAHPWLPRKLAQRYARAYGTLAPTIMGEARTLEDLGEHFGAGLYEREVAYLMEKEWGITPEDIVWRRTKLGLHLTAPQMEALRTWMTSRTNTDT